MTARIVSLLVAAILLAPATMSSAQTLTERPPDADAAANSKSLHDAMQALRDNGYTQGVLMPSALNAGSWIGSARKDGKRVDVTVDSKGQVTQQ